MPARRTVARRRDRVGPEALPASVAALLDPGGRVPLGAAGLWPLLDTLDALDPPHRWHDPLRLLSASGEVLADVLAPAPEPAPDYPLADPLEGDPLP